MTFEFFINSFLLGVGLAMDAFCVSLANGMNEPKMPFKRASFISATFAIFQGLMPLIGWLLVHTVLTYFKIFEHFIPWVALFLLCFIGGKMLYDGIKCQDCENYCLVTLGAILLQGIATSIDALSVGFTIGEYQIGLASISALIIALTTFLLCLVGVFIGKKFGTAISKKATILGGIILIVIGLEIFIKGLINLYA